MRLLIGGLGVELEIAEAVLPGRMEAFRAPSDAATCICVGRRSAAPSHGLHVITRTDCTIWSNGPSDFGFVLNEQWSWTPERVVWAVNLLLRPIIAHYLSARDGVLLHSSGWKRGDDAAVFFGVSGAGKTTIVQRADASEYLCDECMIVRREGGRWYAHGTPFHGADMRAPNNVRAGLRGLYALHKRPGPASVRALPKHEAVARLMRCVILHGSDPTAHAGVLRTVGELADAGLVSALDLGPGVDPWPAIGQKGSLEDVANVG